MTKDQTKKLGDADFDLSKYANEEGNFEDKLSLKNCDDDSDAYIEIHINSKVLDELPQIRNKIKMINNANNVMPVIEERE